MKKSSQHTIDFLFSIALFFVFSATALVVLLLSANIYKDIVTDSENNFETGTALSYIAEKIHQSDENGARSIYLSEFDGYEALAISQEYDALTYITYIYEHNGELKECFIRDGSSVSASAGTTIMQVGELHFTQITDELLSVSCAPVSGKSISTLINIHSDSN